MNVVSSYSILLPQLQRGTQIPSSTVIAYDRKLFFHAPLFLPSTPFIYSSSDNVSESLQICSDGKWQTVATWNMFATTMIHSLAWKYVSGDFICYEFTWWPCDLNKCLLEDKKEQIVSLDWIWNFWVSFI